MEKKEWKRLYDESGNLLYEGSTLNGRPWGAGDAYYPDGSIYRKGIFGIKGLLTGKEYYSSEKLGLNAFFTLNRGYGPHIPVLMLENNEGGAICLH